VIVSSPGFPAIPIEMDSVIALLLVALTVEAAWLLFSTLDFAVFTRPADASAYFLNSQPCF